ncbi:hypothetical protein L0Y47_15055 [Ectopseudomonas composti]
MTELISKYKHIWGDNPRTLLEEYNYQSELTTKLDMLKPEDLDLKTFYEIVLWKLNRFPNIQSDLLDELKGAGTLKAKEHRQAEELLQKLLTTRGSHYQWLRRS